ncbi:MAG: hypothetical protein J1F04_09595 [Oscillospiraceae bacterium]|nr:hypothetical protein [Oscillospiraceae bacterium]
MKQRICICIVLTVMITLLFFTVKENFFGQSVPKTSVSVSAENTAEDGTTEISPTEYEPPSFHISLIDMGVLISVITAYSVHKIREKRKQGRL